MKCITLSPFCVSLTESCQPVWGRLSANQHRQNRNPTSSPLEEEHLPLPLTAVTIAAHFDGQAKRNIVPLFTGLYSYLLMMQGGFRRGRGCVDQIFAVRQVCEKYLAKGKEKHMTELIGKACGLF